ncbi:MAG: hypothetical protein QW746_04515 [Thermoplasmata archaeon]
MQDILKEIETTQNISEEINFDFRPEDEEKLWQWWEENKNEKARFLILPYGIKMIDGEFFYLLEEYGSRMVYEALKIASKNHCQNAFFYLKDDILPLICLKFTRKNAKIYLKEQQDNALELIARDKAKTLYEAKIKIRKGEL